MAEQTLTTNQTVERQKLGVKERQIAPLSSESSGGDFAFAIDAFKDDPMLDAMMANIRARRREIDADDTIE